MAIQGKTDAYEGLILNAEWGEISPITIGPLYVALSTGSVSDDAGTGWVEVAGNGYLRQVLSGALTTGSVAGTIKNDLAAITFPVATPAGQGTIKAVGLVDSGGVLKRAVNIADTPILVGQQFILNINGLTIIED